MGLGSSDRLFLPMLLEAIRVLEVGIVRDPVDLDLGVILGLGFPASRGGILAWCDTAAPPQFWIASDATSPSARGSSRPSRSPGWPRRGDFPCPAGWRGLSVASQVIPAKRECGIT